MSDILETIMNRREVLRVAGELGEADPDLAAGMIELLDKITPEITKLRAERDTAAKALKPFSDAAEDLHEKAYDADNLWESPAAMNLTAGHLRAASAVFATDGKDAT